MNESKDDRPTDQEIEGRTERSLFQTERDVASTKASPRRKRRHDEHDHKEEAALLSKIDSIFDKIPDSSGQELAQAIIDLIALQRDLHRTGIELELGWDDGFTAKLIYPDGRVDSV